MLGWFPGHMNKARRQIKDALPEIDVVIEVLDARLPYSSANPMLAELTRHKPVLKILSRADLADPVRTDEWVAFFDAQADTRALAITTTNTRELKKIPKLCHELAGAVRADRDVRVMVMGIPNVGKSTLINGLAGRKIAKTGNEPAVTKRQQKVRIDGRVALIDTPGVLWPKIEDQASAYRLAASGAIRDTAIEYTDVAIVASAELAKRYPAELTARYKLKALPTYEAPVVEEVDADGPKKPDFLAIAGFDGHAILKEIAGKRGGLRPGGEVDLHRGAEVLLHELRDGKLGRVTLETPADIPPPPAQNDQDSPASSDA
ncbi:ribosome biogenesis GTPase YlqF [Vreelandella aquamarina]|jgi:ribosome biogenesis GTPase A|uniref:ribosome biogenesis GTPase YlqF n=1 Tax=Vreelandella aquamarina TaxID=77097 RepID=UPI0007823126|nr:MULTISPECIES: ribosome biogenesis GTPase YlqF [Halomonas]MEC9304717.1 ribosome biogenesis GTPase YlqF [Pseudomonadota bacterium]MCC4289129.1 ribosome biogenesis GTPase YlqF [Halomonas meridiana]MDK2749652.1 ribosome biogenesis GTPase YlqF [Halomonas meridiana]MED5251115.1 ribosome biogenesis GTPase YlqF [Pseudomonadota bacterium]MED5557009.1 ribosome biogenesis GTPase YlqF [Pseudomonadota bacterium]|tara:strand:+ start:250 stop:1203 length:954 start_codon:yes stop_codon:yes gene_type:complete